RDLAPEIATSASVSKGAKVEAFGSDEDQTVYDTVTVKNLVEGAAYTLDAQLMKKSDSSKIAGASASKEFVASEAGLSEFVKNEDGSVSGVVVVEIPLPAGSLAGGDSAVAFEELTSMVVDAKGHETPDASAPNAIAEHKDIEDAAQTVTYEVPDDGKVKPKPRPDEPLDPISDEPVDELKPEDEAMDEPQPSEDKPAPQPSSSTQPAEAETPSESVTEEPNEPVKPGAPKLELKKYIGTEEFTGQEKPQDQPGADGVVDAQDASKAFEAKEAGQDLTVTFVVTNTGDMDLKDVSVADELTDADTAGIKIGEITPAKQDIKKGESVNFTATLKAPEAGKLHADKAKATGVPVDDQGKEVPWTDEDGQEHTPGEPVDSNDDPAHAKTPQPGESEPGEPELALKKYINGNDAQDWNAAENLKAGEKAAVKFVVTNTGGVDLFNITLSDETVEGVGDVENITPEQIDRLNVGESAEFVGELTLAENEEHKDVAKAEGVPPSPENPDEPGVDEPKVSSNEDPAHAKTPKPGEPVVPVPGEPGQPGEKVSPKLRPGEPEPKITTDAVIEGHGPLVAGATVVDTVSFTGLNVGQRYELESALMCKASGESTGATAKVAFVPQVSDGRINVPIAVTDAGCSEQVVFQTLRDKSGDVVAVHHDINSAAQTVTAEDVLKPAPSPETVEKKRDKNVTVVKEGAPEVGKALAPKSPRRSIKAIPSGSLVLEEGMPSHI
ncbi:VaFE repeat-containing surface-anchored protein, partial [Corynebacterium sp. 21KM1197]